MERLNDDTLLECYKYLELDDILKLTRLNSVFCNLFKKYRNTIYIQFFKHKGYTQLILFIVQSKKSDTYIKEFYKLDKLFRMTNRNIIESYKKRNFVVTQFLLANCKIQNRILDYVSKNGTDYSIYRLLCYNTKIDDEFINDILVELISFKFSKKTIDKKTLCMLIEESNYENRKQRKLPANTIEKLHREILRLLDILDLASLNTVMRCVSALTNNWEYWLDTQQSIIYKILDSIE